MTWTPAYLDSKQDIVDWAIDQNPNLTTGMIPDVDVKMADTMVFAYLSNHNIQVNYTGTVTGSAVDPPDNNNILWAASLAYNLEFLSYRGTIHYTPGGLAKTQFGRVTQQFMRIQPMFFIPRGSQDLDLMMPFRSFKQLAQEFIDAYVKWYTRTHGGSREAIPQVTWDATSRGFGWNADLDVYQGVADAEMSGS